MAILRAREVHVGDRERSVAVVDDDVGVRRALGRLLRASGYSPHVYESAEAFLADHGEATAGCLVLDIHLGGMSGLDLYRRLSAGGKPLPVLFITAHDDDWCREAAALVGGLGVLRKPFDGRMLIESISNALAAAR